MKKILAVFSAAIVVISGISFSACRKPSVPETAAEKLLNSLFAYSVPWDFLPAPLGARQMSYAQSPVSDFSESVNVSELGTKSIGAGLGFVYDALLNADGLYAQFSALKSSVKAIALEIENHVDAEEPEFECEGEAGGFTFRLTHNEEEESAYSELHAEGDTFTAELSYDSETEIREGRVFGAGFALRFTESESDLKAAGSYADGEDLSWFQLELLGTENAVTGYLHVFHGTEEEYDSAFALVFIDPEKTAVVSDVSDGTTVSNEVYNSLTGDYIGTREENAYRFALFSLSGFSTVKAIGSEITVNGGAFRAVSDQGEDRIGISMQAMNYLINGELTAVALPMLYVQTAYIDSLGNHLMQSNQGLFSAAPQLKADNAATANENYALLKPKFERQKDTVSLDAVISYLE